MKHVKFKLRRRDNQLDPLCGEEQIWKHKLHLHILQTNSNVSIDYIRRYLKKHPIRCPLKKKHPIVRETIQKLSVLKRDIKQGFLFCCLD